MSLTIWSVERGSKYRLVNHGNLRGFEIIPTLCACVVYRKLKVKLSNHFLLQKPCCGLLTSARFCYTPVCTPFGVAPWALRNAAAFAVNVVLVGGYESTAATAHELFPRTHALTPSIRLDRPQVPFFKFSISPEQDSNPVYQLGGARSTNCTDLLTNTSKSS